MTQLSKIQYGNGDERRPNAETVRRARPLAVEKMAESISKRAGLRYGWTEEESVAKLTQMRRSFSLGNRRRRQCCSGRPGNAFAMVAWERRSVSSEVLSSRPPRAAYRRTRRTAIGRRSSALRRLGQSLSALDGDQGPHSIPRRHVLFGDARCLLGTKPSCPD